MAEKWHCPRCQADLTYMVKTFGLDATNEVHNALHQELELEAAICVLRLEPKYHRKQRIGG